MSCRVLKRGMEEFIINKILSTASELGFRRVIGEYLPTPKNAMVKDLYEAMGFVRVGENRFEAAASNITKPISRRSNTMTRQEIFEKLNQVFSDVFDEELTVTDETTASDIEVWDSLTHITLISEVEDTFDIKFAMKDVLAMQNVGQMADIIAKSI